MFPEVLNNSEQELLLKIARDNIKAYLSEKYYELPDNLPYIFVLLSYPLY